jgi:hypothetical protein
MRWTTLYYERAQIVSKYINIFHILCIKVGIRDSKWNLFLKFCCGLPRYIEIETGFLDMSSLGATY